MTSDTQTSDDINQNLKQNLLSNNVLLGNVKKTPDNVLEIRSELEQQINFMNCDANTDINNHTNSQRDRSLLDLFCV